MPAVPDPVPAQRPAADPAVNRAARRAVRSGGSSARRDPTVPRRGTAAVPPPRQWAMRRH